MADTRDGLADLLSCTCSYPVHGPDTTCRSAAIPAVRAYVAAQADAAVIAYRDRLAERIRNRIHKSELDGAEDPYVRGMRCGLLYVTGEIDEPLFTTARGDT